MTLPAGFPLAFDQVSFRAEGVTSRVHQVQRGEQLFALRVAKAPVAYLPDASIRRHLKSWGLAVAVATHYVGKGVHQKRSEKEAQARNRLAKLLNDRI
ncbi:hypothetical protein [Deinococcus cellulosilyticus]|uniref:Uncharacterized protein n=1 Tax=Deinococcus cellulosilyticus (strain DSM 18568 / NBRC 106333 / KACC 11606 / 5516J-15) TaxID=1223518 RepID=A0A511N0N5_DEIC1|nr:hypothetical protein [Deinococcus cellulosilyticus]GEM46440.1 hypothetical protein DC3_20750 [Deinococcus cellulosilyticus NBRC 106333 = KACC 11606]